MQTISRKPFQNSPPPPRRVPSKRQWKKYFLFKKYHTIHIRCWSQNSPAIHEQTKHGFMKSVCGIPEKYSGSALWLRWLCLGCLPLSVSTFGRKNSIHEWKKLNFREQSLTFILTLTDIHSKVINGQPKLNACGKVRKQYLTDMLKPHLLALLRLLLLSSKNGISPLLHSGILSAGLLDYNECLLYVKQILRTKTVTVQNI